MPNSEVIHNKNYLYTEYVLQDYDNTKQNKTTQHNITQHNNNNTTTTGNRNTSLLLLTHHINQQHKTCTDCQV